MRFHNSDQNKRKCLSGIGRRKETAFYRANKGSLTIETCIALPLFLFLMLFFFHIVRVEETKAVIYEAVGETVEYLAEYAYLKKKLGSLGEAADGLSAALKFREYLDDSALVNTYVKGGSFGVLFPEVVVPDENGMVEIKYAYIVNVSVPFLPAKYRMISGSVVQKAYLGDEQLRNRQDVDWDDYYVYVTDNKEVYHSARKCTHLDLSISEASKEEAKYSGYIPCGFCGDKAEDTVYVTSEGGRYHGVSMCSGLKRTVQRVKHSEVEGLPPCSRCGGY